MSERDLQAAVIDLAHTLNWIVAHFRPAVMRSGKWATPVQADGAGFPDLVLVRDRVIFAEIKSERGRLSKAQETWIDRLHDANAEAVVIMPEDWRSGGVEKMLRYKPQEPRNPPHQRGGLRAWKPPFPPEW